MRLSETAENFMKHNTPQWHWCFQHDMGFERDIIGNSRVCVMGELYNWSNRYEPTTKNVPTSCETCHYLGCSITRNALAYKSAKDRKDMAMMDYISDQMDDVIQSANDHVKHSHAELLKQEEEIEAV